MKPLTIEDFRKWLQEQPDEREFEVCNGHDCPLAVYINEGALVGALFITFADKERIALPRWAVDFIWNVDHTPEQARGRIKNKVVRGILDSLAGFYKQEAQGEQPTT
jgi:hypothetical protein